MTHSEPGYIACQCSLCNGGIVRQSVAIKHRKDAELMERRAARRLSVRNNDPSPPDGLRNGDEAVDGLANEVFRWTLGGRTSDTREQSSAIWERDKEELPSKLLSPAAPTLPTPMPPRVSSSSSSKATRASMPTSLEPGRTVYDELLLLDNKLQARINNVVYLLGADATMIPGDPLKDHMTWFRTTLQTLQSVKPGDDIAAKTLLTVMLERVEDHISKIEIRTRAREDELPVRQAEEVNTCVYHHQNCL